MNALCLCVWVRARVSVYLCELVRASMCVSLCMRMCTHPHALVGQTLEVFHFQNEFLVVWAGHCWARVRALGEVESDH